jgi:hypothetical protein
MILLVREPLCLPRLDGPALPRLAPRHATTAARRRPAPRDALGWAALFFVAGQAALLVAMYTWWPHLRDPEFSYKLDRLRFRVAENPGRPLVMMLGSSRVARGFCPAALAETWPEGRPTPLAFNGSLMGAGTLHQLLCLDRFRRAGVRPDWLFIEYWPPHADRLGEEGRIDVNRLEHDDLTLLSRYIDGAAWVRRRWRSCQWVPAYSHRNILQSLFVPTWQPWGRRLDGNWSDLDPWGWQGYGSNADGLQHRRWEKARTRFAATLNDYRIGDESGRALREMLDHCRQEGIGVALLFLPESTAMQHCYPPAVRAAVDAHFRSLGTEYGVPAIDARDWVADELFHDGYHLLPEGAVAFTRRFGREVLRPLLAAGKEAPTR